MNNPVGSGSRIDSKHIRVMLVRFSLIAVFTLGSGLLWSSPASAQASPQTDVFTFPLVDDYYFNQCPGGEDMVLNGSVHLILHTTQDAQGGLLIVTRQSGAFRAIGVTTGTKYVWIQVVGNVQNYPWGDPPFQFAQTVMDRIVGPGPNHGQLMKETAHITVNANGEWVVIFDKFTSDCS